MKSTNLVIIGTLFLNVLPGRAAVVRLEVPELTAKAKRIVIGDVAEVTGFRHPTNGQLKTRIVIRRCTYLLGEGSGTEILEMPGGTIGDLALRISIFPVFEPGDHVLLFLDGEEGALRLVGGFQGAYLTDGRVVARMAPGARGIVSQSLRPLAEMRRLIQAALPSGAPLPAPAPYEGSFIMPPGQTASEDCYVLRGGDWTYQADPMGEDYVVRANCSDSACGSASSQVQQIRNGADAWEAACAGFHFSYGGTSFSCTMSLVDPDGTNCVYFEQAWLFPPDALAVAGCWSSPSGNNILECDLAFNDDVFTWWNGSGACPSGAHDIWSTAAHEFGHWVGLADLYDLSCSDQTMYGYGDSCETHARDVEAGDIKGILAIYGNRCGDGQCEAACAESPCSCGVDCAGCCDDDDCDDGVYCNGVETCVGGTCQPGPPVDCDDGVACTVDSCNEATDACDHGPDDSACADGLFCNGAETCHPLGGCQMGTFPCDDGVGCTEDTCNEATHTCTNTPNDANCVDDDLFCNGSEVCDGVNDCVSTGDPCAAGTFCNETTETCDQCQVGAHCDDGVTCTDDTCVSGSCVFTANNANCNDGLFCNGTETCDPVLDCQAGIFPCDDGVGCTDDTCDEATGTCTNTINDTNCDDGLFCNGAETCDPVDGCQPGTPVNCDDGVACTVDSCNEATDACNHAPDDSACADGLFCNGAESCDPLGGCQPGSAPCVDDAHCDEAADKCVCLLDEECNDGLPCTTDTCADHGWCFNQPDTGWCVINNVCYQDGALSPDNDCERCEPRTDPRRWTPRPEGAACGDASDTECDNPDSCDGHGSCLPNHEPGGMTCSDDGNDCTDDVCEAGFCTHPDLPFGTSCGDPSESECDNPDTCNGDGTCLSNHKPAGTSCGDDADTACDNPDSCDGNGNCLNNHELAGTSCDDGLFCNGFDTCLDGVCQPSGNPCASEGLLCDEVSDGCYCDDATDCDDGLFCTGVESCIGGECRSAGNPCVAQGLACDEAHDECDCDDDGDCDDGHFCNGPERCAGGSCLAGTPPNCDDGIDCTTDICDEGEDRCDNTPNDSACDDGLFCNGTETCDPGNGCQAGTPPDCDDAVACTRDSCDETGDACTHVPEDAECNDGVFCNGVETCDPTNGCQSGQPPACSDGNDLTVDECDTASDRCRHGILMIEGADEVTVGASTRYTCAIVFDDGSSEDVTGGTEWRVVDAENPTVLSGCATITTDGILAPRDHCLLREINVEARVEEQGIELVALHLVSILPALESEGELGRLVPDRDQRPTCGPCGAFGMITWTLLLLGLLGLRSDISRSRVKHRGGLGRDLKGAGTYGNRVW